MKTEIEIEFAPYKQALALKELGFNEECFSYYNLKEEITFKSCYNKVPIIMSGKKCGIPLYQQAFRWFREKHYLYAIIIPTMTMHWTFKTTTVVKGMVEVPPYNHVHAIDYSTYEEAELECLKKLIEIVKNARNS